MNQPATLLDTISRLQRKDVSSRELTENYLQAIEAAGDINAYITVCGESALQQAAQADQALARGTAGMLCGVPIAHKDIFCSAGVRTTCGSNMLHNFIAPYDATVVHKLASAGAVTLGKTNMDEFAMGSSNENSHYGPVQNPWQLDRVPGGSSGGSAAAVAAGLCVAATGTDTGGSIRQPAAFCGVTGLKPTYGRVSRYGMIAFASSLDQGGVLARSAGDAALMLACMSGFDTKDSTSANRQDKWLQQLHSTGQLDPTEQLNIGIPREYFGPDIDAGTAAVLETAYQALQQAGHKLVDISLPHTDAAIAAYYVIAGAEASTNLSRYDGVRFGHRCEQPTSLEDLYVRSRSEGFGEEVKRRILTGTYALSVGYYDAYYLKAQKIRRLIACDFDQAFDTVDVIATPTTCGPAFEAGSLTHDPVAMYAQDKFTVPTSLAGLPALSMPCGSVKSGSVKSGSVKGLPVGMQLIAPAFRENLILSLADQYQAATQWHLQTPAAYYAPQLEGK